MTNFKKVASEVIREIREDWGVFGREEG